MVKAYKKRGNDFIFIGNFTAPLLVLNKYLANTLIYGGEA
jgi:hypothetical protein